MKRNTMIRMAAAGALLMSGLLSAQTVWAGSKSVERAGPRGGSASMQRERGAGYAQRSVERQYANGASASAARQRSYDADSGAYSAERYRSVTGAEGQTATSSRSVTRDDGSATITRQGTGPQGQSWEYQRSHGDGQAEASLTTSSGASYNRTRSYEPGSD